jgi:hypothetical protein
LRAACRRPSPLALSSLSIFSPWRQRGARLYYQQRPLRIVFDAQAGRSEFSTVTEADLIRFINAQSQIYAQVVEELTGGRKRTHWMWFIFPQLAGLGRSAMADRYVTSPYVWSSAVQARANGPRESDHSSTVWPDPNP